AVPGGRGPPLPRHPRVTPPAGAFRYGEDAPLLTPPVNAQHARLVREQQRQRDFRGFIVPIPNCTTTGLAISLAPLDAAFGVSSVLMTSLQAVSGAGRSPGVIAIDVLDNVIPHIAKEEGKVEVETKKILGALAAGHAGVAPHPMRVSCTCTRVAVLEGHTEAVFVSLRRRASTSEVAEAMRHWKGDERTLSLHSAPPRWIEVLDDPYRPQPRF